MEIKTAMTITNFENRIKEKRMTFKEWKDESKNIAICEESYTNHDGENKIRTLIIKVLGREI